jgi:uncharacterized protein (DUF1778 family)
MADAPVLAPGIGDVLIRLTRVRESLNRKALYGQHPCINLPWHGRSNMATVNRNDRIELRTTKEEKRLLAAAAAYERLDVTSFIMRNVLPAAREAVGRAERIVLSKRDTARVLALLESPPKPTAALLAAARRRVRQL